MRNLKRVLSLGLASVMLMGMMVVGAGAASKDFTDAAEIKNVEAVDVMVALGVLQGGDKGDFQPNSILTREQAAKIICYMLLGPENAEKLATSGAVFSDVAANRWSAPYIAYCVNLGILAGDGNGNFFPEGKLTGAAFAKMLLVALGYDATIEQYVGDSWTINVATAALDAGILPEGMVLTNELSRQDAAQLAFNTLSADMVKYENKGSTIVVGGVEISQGASKAEVVTSTQSWAGNINKDGVETVSATNPYTVQFGEKYFSGLKLNASKSADDFGAPANVWTYKDFEGKYSKSAILTYTDEVKPSDLVEDIEDAGYKIDKTSGTTSLTVWSNGDGSETYTGAQVANAISTNTAFGGKGIELKVYDKNGDDTADTIVMVYTYAAQVTHVEKDDKDTKDDERALTVTAYMGDGNATVTLNKDTVGFETVYGNVEENDIVLVTPKNDTTSATAAWTVSIPESVTGAVTAKKSDSITVGGTKYDIAACEKAVSSATLDANKDVVLYLDVYGNAIHTTAVSSTESADVVYVTTAYPGTDAWGSEVKMFQGVLTDGTIITGKVDKVDNEDKAATPGTAYQYTKDGDSYKLTAAAGNSSTVGARLLNGASAITTSSKKVDDIYFAGDVNFVYVTGTKNDVKVTVKSGVQAASATILDTAYGVISKDADGNYVVSTVFVASNAVSSSDDLIYIAEAWESTSSDVKYGDDGETKLYGYEAYLNGEKTTIYVESQGVKAVGFYTYSVDDTTGAYSLASEKETTGVAEGKTVKVAYVNGNYYITAEDTTVVDFAANDAKVIDTRENGKINSLSALKNEDNTVTATILYNGNDEVVEYIYITNVAG